MRDRQLAERAVEAVLAIDPLAPGADMATRDAQLRAATQRVSDADLAYGAAVTLLDSAIEARDLAAESARKLIDEVKGKDGLKDSRWDNFKAAAVDVLNTVAKALDTIALAAGVLALAFAAVPFVGPFLGAVAIWATTLSLAVKLTLAALGQGDLLDIALTAAAVATFGVSRVASGGLLRSGRGLQGAARLEAGRFAAEPPAIRAAAGLPTDTNSTTALGKMMGGANISKSSARDMVRQAAEENSFFTRRGAQAAWRDLREVPGDTWEDIKSIRHFDLRHPVQQYRNAEGAGTGMSFLGERAVGAQILTLREVDPTLLRMDSLNLYRSSNQAHTGAVATFWAIGVGLQSSDAYRYLHPDPSAAQILRLRGDAPFPVPAGVR